MNKLENFDVALAEVEEIKMLRQQLAEFNLAQGAIEVVFKMPGGNSICVPVNSKAKARLISKEIRNYLAEEQLMKQFKED